MSENYWSYEHYRKLLRDSPNEHLWGIVLHDLRNRFTPVAVNVHILEEEVRDIPINVKEVLETLRELKTASQHLVNVFSAVETHLIDAHKSDTDNLT
jgi:hypothetical protein